MKKIESLTKEQTAQLEVYRDKWMNIGLATGKANRSAAEEALRDAYRIAGLEPPKLIVWAESPMGVLLAVKLLKEFLKKYPKNGKMGDSVGDSVWDSVWASVGASVRASVRASVWDSVRASVWDSVGASVRASVGDSVWDSVRASVWDSVWDSVRASVWDSVRASVWDSVRASVRASVWDSVRASGLRTEWNELGIWGQHDASWLGFYEYFLEVLNLKDCKKLEPLSRLAKEAGWVWVYQNVAVITERPVELNTIWNEQRKCHIMHKDGGPAIRWSDGYALYRLNGINVPEKLAVTPKKELDAREWLKEANVDIRREAFRKIGIDEVILQLGGKVIDTFDSKMGGIYELLMVDIGLDKPRPYLKMKNQSIGEYHVEGVPAGTKSVQDALAWRMGLDKYKEPLALT